MAVAQRQVVGGRSLPNSLQTMVGQELEPGEQLLWTGQPAPLRTLPGNIGLMLFGIPWTAFSLFWMAMAAGIGSRAPEAIGLLFALFGLPFVLIGLAMLSSPYWAWRDARRTAYIITDRRIIFLTRKGRKGRKVKAYTPTNLGDFERQERGNGSGDLTIQKHSYRDSDGNRQTESITLTGIPEVRRVESLVRDIFAKPQVLTTPQYPNVATAVYGGYYSNNSVEVPPIQRVGRDNGAMAAGDDATTQNPWYWHSGGDGER